MVAKFKAQTITRKTQPNKSMTAWFRIRVVVVSRRLRLKYVNTTETDKIITNYVMITIILITIILILQVQLPLTLLLPPLLPLLVLLVIGMLITGLLCRSVPYIIRVRLRSWLDFPHKICL